MARSWPSCSRRRLTWPRRTGSTGPAGGWSPTWARTRGRRSTTSTSTSWAGARCGGRPDSPYNRLGSRSATLFAPPCEGEGPRGTPLAKATTQVKILVPGNQPMVALLGERDQLLKVVEAAFDSQILVRGNEITITGDPEEAELVARLFEELMLVLERGHALTPSSIGQTIDMIKGDEARPSDVLTDVVLTSRGKSIAPKTIGQKRYADAIRRSTLTFAIGPAGTGKTYLAVATAVKALQDRNVCRIILTRPAVEAGERLGFLPGTLYEKIDPYLKPLYDALFEMMDADSFHRLMERGTIEVAPLAYMRGRTLNDSFIILDEAQNTSPEQMKMFLTRLGF